METTYIGAMKGIHDRLVQKVGKGDLGREDFAGLGLSHTGDGQLITDAQVKQVRESVPEMRKLEKKIQSKLILGEGLVFNKTLFFQMLRRAGNFTCFFHIDDKTGMTHSVHGLSDVEKRKNAHGLSTLLGFIAAMLVVGVIVLCPLTTGWKIGLSIILGAVSWGMVSSTFYAKNSWTPLNYLKAMDPNKMVDYLWPNGTDQMAVANGPAGTVQLRVRVRFPDRSTEVDDLIHQVVAAGKKIGATPFLVAHRHAIGIDLENAEQIRAVRNTDPFVGLMLGSSVIIFPKTLFGNIVEEKEMIDRLEQSYSTMRFSELN